MNCFLILCRMIEWYYARIVKQYSCLLNMANHFEMLIFCQLFNLIFLFYTKIKKD